MSRRTRYAVVGLGGRSHMYTRAIVRDFADRAELVGLCDLNQTRMDYWNRVFAEEYNAAPVPTFGAERFDEMIRQQKVDCVVVTTIDRTHHQYIIRAMELGCDAITEKPMTVDAPRCQAILDTIARTGRRLTVTFNYRYAPRNSRVKQLLMDNAIGQVLSVHFEWLLDTVHGADYFRRWHRDKRNGGGLMVHKATHHFDLVNWWLNSRPVKVFGLGRLAFYGRENAEQRGQTRFYDRAHNHPAAREDPFALHMAEDPRLRGLYLDAEHEDGYIRDQSVFGHNISIEDDMAVLVQYASGASLSYHLTAYSPWEGFRIAFNGTRGRLEYDVEERSYISAQAANPHQPPAIDPSLQPEEIHEPARILLRPHWGRPMRVELPTASEGGHGGGDRRLLEDIFADRQPDPLGRAADHVDGAWSILTGIAANLSFASGMPVETAPLVRFP